MGWMEVRSRSRAWQRARRKRIGIKTRRTCACPQVQHSDVLVLGRQPGHSHPHGLLEGEAAQGVLQHTDLAGRHLDVRLDGDVVVRVLHVVLAFRLLTNHIL